MGQPEVPTTWRDRTAGESRFNFVYDFGIGVRVAGASQLSMVYDYEMINGVELR